MARREGDVACLTLTWVPRGYVAKGPVLRARYGGFGEPSGCVLGFLRKEVLGEKRQEG